jgi:shikimate dehydrogenase
VTEARAGEYLGFNVTIPHKERIVPMLGEVHGEAAAIHAVNTVALEGGTLAGYNTDVTGFSEALRGISPRPPRTALVLGAGGAARAVLYALWREGVAVQVSSRSSDRVGSLQTAVPGTGVIPWDRREEALHESDLVVNATPLGMAPLAGMSPVPRWPPALPGSIAFDLVYGAETPFLHDASRAGWRTVDGLDMLVRQAGGAFHLWFGVEPDLQAMRRAAAKETACSGS